MRIASHLDFMTVAIYLSVVAACVYAYMIHRVVRLVSFRNPLQLHFPRLWREHKRHFPHSGLRTIFVLLIVGIVVCVILDRLR